MMPTESKWYRYKLDCGHSVYSDVELRQQYETDYHHIFCPNCEQANRDVYGSVPTAWAKVVGASNADAMHNVFSRDEFIVPDRILRIQPSVPATRVRPFPYVKRVRT